MNSCKDYDSDIDNLQQQINSINTLIGTLQSQVNSGNYITGVTQNGETVTITTTNSSYSFTVGSDASVWTIGADGYWYKDGQKTDYYALGTVGEQGPEGPQGPQGVPGNYYVPNEDGYFYLYDGETGEVIEKTDIKWNEAISGGQPMPGMDQYVVSVVYSGGKLMVTTYNNETQTTETYTIGNGDQLAALDFIPEYYTSGAPYPTTVSDFFSINQYLDSTKYYAAKGFDAQGNPVQQYQYIPQYLTDGVLNKVVLPFRINPSTAYIPEPTDYTFLNRIIVSRAAGDMTGLLEVVNDTIVDDVLQITAQFAGSNPAEDYNSIKSNPGTADNIAALVANIPGGSIVSDYVTINSTEVDEYWFVSTQNGIQDLYRIILAPVAAGPQGMAYITANGVPVPNAAGFGQIDYVYNYSGVFDLDDYIDIAVEATNGATYLLSTAGYDIEYTYSMPAEYIQGWTPTNATGQNQQEFINVTADGIVTNLMGTASIGRTPIVKVSATLTDDEGNQYWLGAAYVVINVVERTQQVGLVGSTVLTMEETVNYTELDGASLNTNANQNAGVLNSLTYETLNKMFESSELSPADFWNVFNAVKFELTLNNSNSGNNVPYSWTSGEYSIANSTGISNITFTNSAYSAPNNSISGVGMALNAVTQGNVTPSTQVITFLTNNLIHTQLWKGIVYDNQPSANFTVVATFFDGNGTYENEFTVTQNFTVTNDFTGFTQYYTTPTYYSIAASKAQTTSTTGVYPYYVPSIDNLFQYVLNTETGDTVGISEVSADTESQNVVQVEYYANSTYNATTNVVTPWYKNNGGYGVVSATNMVLPTSTQTATTWAYMDWLGTSTSTVATDFTTPSNNGNAQTAAGAGWTTNGYFAVAANNVENNWTANVLPSITKDDCPYMFGPGVSPTIFVTPQSGVTTDWSNISGLYFVDTQNTVASMGYVSTFVNDETYNKTFTVTFQSPFKFDAATATGTISPNTANTAVQGWATGIDMLDFVNVKTTVDNQNLVINGALQTLTASLYGINAATGASQTSPYGYGITGNVFYNGNSDAYLLGRAANLNIDFDAMKADPANAITVNGVTVETATDDNLLNTIYWTSASVVNAYNAAVYCNQWFGTSFTIPSGYDFTSSSSLGIEFEQPDAAGYWYNKVTGQIMYYNGTTSAVAATPAGAPTFTTIGNLGETGLAQANTILVVMPKPLENLANLPNSYPISVNLNMTFTQGTAGTSITWDAATSTDVYAQINKKVTVNVNVR